MVGLGSAHLIELTFELFFIWSQRFYQIIFLITSGCEAPAVYSDFINEIGVRPSTALICHTQVKRDIYHLSSCNFNFHLKEEKPDLSSTLHSLYAAVFILFVLPFYVWIRSSLLFSKVGHWHHIHLNYTFFIRKSFFCLSLNFLNMMLEIRLRFS